MLITGLVMSSVHVTVRETGRAELPQLSVTFQVRVCERRQPVLVTLLVVAIAIRLALHPSVTVAVPKALLIVVEDGLQPNMALPPVMLMPGASLSATTV